MDISRSMTQLSKPKASPISNRLDPFKEENMHNFHAINIKDILKLNTVSKGSLGKQKQLRYAREPDSSSLVTESNLDECSEDLCPAHPNLSATLPQIRGRPAYSIGAFDNKIALTSD